VFDCLPDVVADPDRAVAVTQELLAGAGMRDELAAVVLALVDAVAAVASPRRSVARLRGMAAACADQALAEAVAGAAYAAAAGVAS
jgi:hypothetical protein